MSSHLALGFRFARRELRGGLKGLRIVLACLALGVGAIAAVGVLRTATEAGLAEDGARILGGDLSVRVTYRPMPQDARDWITSRGGRLSEIGHAVESVVRPRGYGLLEDYTGHGIGTSMHEPPNVLNLAPRGPGHGMALEPGIVLAVEPMATLGEPDVVTLDDDWTVVTVDGRQAAHWEHTVAVTPEGPWVLTALDGGASRLGRAVPESL